MMQEQVRFDEVAITDWSRGMLRAVGLEDGDAEVVTTCLLFAQRRGVVGHGLVRLPIYLERIAAGGINRTPDIRTTVSGAVAVIDGDNGTGARVGLAAVSSVSSAAFAQGIGLAVARNANHFGAAGYYAAELASTGLVGIAVSNADPIMIPPGGGRAVLGSNPLAIAVPGDADAPGPLLDMATTAVAHGKIMAAARAGEAIPEGWAVDADGAPTTDPTAALAGALLPAAGPKGFGLSFMIDLLAAGLSGGAIGVDIAALYGSREIPQGVCLLMLAIDPAACASRGHLDATVARLTTAVRSSRDGGHPLGMPLVPGEPEIRYASAAPGTVAVASGLVEDLRTLSTACSVPFPSPVHVEPGRLPR